MSAWSNQVGHRLAGSLEPGERFAVLAKNSLDWLAIYLGASKAGVVPVPLNFRLMPPEWRYIVADSGARLVVVGEELREPLGSVLDETAVTERAVLGSPVPGWQSFADDVAAQPVSLVGTWVPDQAAAYQMYTSGTTGRPKGAVISHAAVTNQLLQLMTATRVREASALVVMPLFHAAATITTLLNVASGTTSHISSSFDAPETVRLLDEGGIAMTTLAPAMISALLAVPGVETRSFADLELILYGASAISADVLRRAMSALGCELLQAYGMTETTAVATWLTAADHRRALDGDERLLKSAGRPLLGTEVRIVGPDDQPLPEGQLGEIVVRGPQLLTEYWNQPEATADTVRDGWLHTGDAGTLDEAGYLFVSDRIKDMYVSGGENVYPREVEDVLFGLPGVEDAAVVGIPDERWGEVGVAFIVASSTAHLEQTDVIGHCRERLAGYKCPKSVTFLDTLPRNATGKVLKKDLKAPYQRERERTAN